MATTKTECEFCHDAPLQADLLHTSVDTKTIVFIENNLLHLQSMNSHVAREIEYCPACGRKLTEVTDDEQ